PPGPGTRGPLLLGRVGAHVARRSRPGPTWARPTPPVGVADRAVPAPARVGRHHGTRRRSRPDGLREKFPFSASISLARAGPIGLTGVSGFTTQTGARMNAHWADELATLGQLTVARLRARYAELFGEETRVGNKLWLIRRVAWRLQALAEGDLSQRARQRAAELA